jgi:hypothetical protein
MKVLQLQFNNQRICRSWHHLQLRTRSGRGGGIRTRDPLRPRQVRYQTALHPDPSVLNERFLTDFLQKLQVHFKDLSFLAFLQRYGGKRGLPP